MLLELERPVEMTERKYNLVEIVQQLIANMKLLGWSKYKMAQELGHTWGTIHAWERGWWKPEPMHLNKLQTIFIAECTKRGMTTFEFMERYGIVQK